MALTTPFSVCKEFCAGSGGGSGADGLSTYEIAVKNGFKGTEQEWLDSLHGEDGYTPQKGIDYWTEEDKAEIISSIPGGGGGDTEIFVVNMTCTEIIPGGGGAATSDKTYAEVLEAYESGKLVLCNANILGVEMSTVSTRFTDMGLGFIVPTLTGHYEIYSASNIWWVKEAVFPTEAYVDWKVSTAKGVVINVTGTVDGVTTGNMSYENVLNNLNNGENIICVVDLGDTKLRTSNVVIKANEIRFTIIDALDSYRIVVDPSGWYIYKYNIYEICAGA